jgi:hypothetical protein
MKANIKIKKDNKKTLKEFIKEIENINRKEKYTEIKVCPDY